MVEGFQANEIQEYLGHKTTRIIESFFSKLDEYLEHVKKHPFLLERGIPVVDITNFKQAVKKKNGTENSITVEVPASTCNLGPGLDTLGLALSLYTRLTFTLTDNKKATGPSINFKGSHFQ